jgi:UDP-galactopyranose mutase
MLRADYVVVGSGLTGATVARVLADTGREVLVLERRAEAGGNVRDRIHEPSGLRYHVYGPHYFRTNCERLWEWVQRFSPFYSWAAKVQTFIGGTFYRWPLRVGDRHLWGQAVNGYNLKMWGTVTPPEEVQSRVEMRLDDGDERLKTDRYQGLPTLGYSGLIANLLYGIPVVLNYDYLWHRREVVARQKLIYTGPIDELFDFELGKLAYRGQRRDLLHCYRRSPVQEVVQVNEPDPTVGHIRSIEWNYLAEQPSWEKGSLLTFETPYTPESPGDYEYPYNDAANQELYRKYRARAECCERLLVAGRLGTYRYLDMDQSIAAALKLAEGLLK